MLKHLVIKNYALIRALEISPASGLNVITGETGAGKSIMLGAIGLLMGHRADTKVLWNDEEKCIIDGVFDIRHYKLQRLFKSEDLDYDDETVLRREISPGGKSRAFINDTPVTLDVMKKIGGRLLDIHSQHETLLLANQDFQLSLIDAYAGNDRLRQAYEDTWDAFVKARKALDKLTREADSLREEADFVNFQLEELTSAELEDDTEQETLEAEQKVMDHAGEIKLKLQQATDILNGAEFASRATLGEARQQLQSIGAFGNTYETLYSRLDSLLIELDDIIAEAEKAGEDVEFDPERAEVVKERLSLLYRLQKKHRLNDVKELIALRDDLAEKAAVTSNLDGALAQAAKTFEAAQAALQAAASQLSASRSKTFNALTKKLETLLKELGIANASLAIDHQTVPPTASGTDEVNILFSANKGIAPQPLARVASGGEFSRVMFALKYVMAERTSLPTLILDEIDTGVSGEIALKLGKLMQTMAAHHQLITITHLPQVAAQGGMHYFAYKDHSADKTASNIRMLTKQERIEEIAQMIGGANPSKIALQGARELLAAGQ